MIGAGDLDARVRFDKRGLDANGDAMGDWGEHITVWAKVEYLRGSEAAQSHRIEGRQPVTIDIRDSATAREIGTGFRAVIVGGRHVIAGQVLNITAAAPSRQRGFLNIMAVAGGASG